MPYFFATSKAGRVAIVGGDARHLSRSLRARVGDEIEVVDSAGLLLTVRLETVSVERVEGAVVAQREHHPEPRARISIAVANLPAPALELVLSRCTEAGAFGFTVIQADRSVARGVRLDRWQTICREASMLAGRFRVPAVAGPVSLEDAVGSSEAPVMLVRGAPPLAGLLSPRDLTLLVGPEGGWSEREQASVKRKAGLGPRNLRSDTAALVGLAVALASRG